MQSYFAFQTSLCLKAITITHIINYHQLCRMIITWCQSSQHWEHPSTPFYKCFHFQLLCLHTQCDCACLSHSCQWCLKSFEIFHSALGKQRGICFLAISIHLRLYCNVCFRQYTHTESFKHGCWLCGNTTVDWLTDFLRVKCASSVNPKANTFFFSSHESSVSKTGQRHRWGWKCILICNMAIAHQCKWKWML